MKDKLQEKELRDKVESLNNYDATDGLPEWESNFIASIAGQLEKGYELSSKQIEKIEELYERRINRYEGKRFHERR